MSDTLRLLIPILLTHGVAIVVIVFVVKRMLLGDTTKAVGQVKQVEADIRKKEAAMREQIEEHDREFRRKKTEAEEELERHRQEGEKELARQRDQVLNEARVEGDRIVEQARRNEEKLRAQIAQDMEEKAVEYAGEIVGMVFTDRMAEAVDRVFTDELLDALGDIDAATITVDANEVSFTAARSIAPEQRQRLESLLRDQFGVEVHVEENLDASLVAGLLFKLGSLEIDGSLRNRMREAIDEVKREARA